MSFLLCPIVAGGAEYTVGAAWMMDGVGLMAGWGPCLGAGPGGIETMSPTCLQRHEERETRRVRNEELIFLEDGRYQNLLTSVPSGKATFQSLVPSISQHVPEDQPCVGGAETDPEASDPAWGEGPSWVEEEEVGATEVQWEDRASSAAADHLKVNT